MSITSLSIFGLAFFFFAIGAVGSLLLRKQNMPSNWWGNGCAIIGSLIALAFSISILSSGSVLAWQSISFNSLLTLSVYIDRLSACFIFLISLIALFASVYSIGYSKHYDTDEHRMGLLGFFYNIFLGGMLLVVTAHQSVYFLVVWEIMSLASYFLVIFEGRDEETQKAGLLYFVMTHVGTAFLTVAFLLLYRSTGSFDFGMIKEQLSSVSLATLNIVFLCCFIGFGTKAGMIPVHIWLPKAHPAAPSFVSALMSGVMIKTGIYMLIRILMDVMPVAPIWWGILIMMIGSCSAFLGVLYALAEGDMKKMLAYCSIENIGIILIGFGSSMVFWSLGMHAFAVIALAAALFHILNHAIYKALLFFCAGALISATHSRNMEAYGGLIKRMPVTATCFFVGAMAISAMPPLNGFFSEWMTLQALFQGIMNVDSVVRWVFMVAITALAFAGGLATFTFVKAFGVSFLARPRSESAEGAKEVEMSLRVSMVALSMLTIVIGLFAGKIASFLYLVAGERTAFSGADVMNGLLSATYLRGASSISMPWLFAGLTGVLAIVWLIVRFTTRNRSIRYERTWDCGTTLGPRMEMTPMGFSRTMILIFKGVLRPTRQASHAYRDADDRYFSRPSRAQFGLKDVYQSHFYGPIQHFVASCSEFAKTVQNGNVNAYVAYILITLVALLFVSRLF
jgi:hydrogenase-4 component B